jgi:hypothetical protein
LIGFLILVRRRAETLLLLILPIALQMAVFAAANVGIHPRYFAIALPAVILVGAEGLKHSVETLVKRFPFAATIRERTVVGCLALAVLASAQPLIRYYQYPKQDFLGAQTYIGSNARDDDLFFGIHSSGSVLGNFYDLPFRRIETLEELLEYESYGQRIWLVTTLERVISAAAPDLLEHIHNNYTQQIRFPGTVGDGTVIVYLLDGIADGD